MWDEDDEPVGALDDELFSREWPDDDDEPTVPDGLEAPLDADDDVHADRDDPTEAADEPDAEPLDDLEDLGAPDDTEIPVLDTELEIRVDGEAVPARVDWGRERSVLVRPAGAGADRDVLLEIGGQRVRATVGVVAGDQSLVLLGRDVLKGRFLLRA